MMQNIFRFFRNFSKQSLKTVLNATNNNSTFLNEIKPKTAFLRKKLEFPFSIVASAFTRFGELFLF